MFSTFPFVGANLTGVIMLYIEITAWKARAYGILTRDGEVRFVILHQQVTML